MEIYLILWQYFPLHIYKKIIFIPYSLGCEIEGSETMQNKKLQIRIDENLEKKVNDFCIQNNLTKSAFIKSLILYFFKDETYTKIMFKDEHFKTKLLYEIHRYGNNINQIAYKLNVALMSQDLSHTDKNDILEASNNIKEQTELIQEITNLVGACL